MTRIRLISVFLLINLVSAQYFHRGRWGPHGGFGRRQHGGYGRNWYSGGRRFGSYGEHLNWGSGLALAGTTFAAGFAGAALGSLLGNGLVQGYNPYYYSSPSYSYLNPYYPQYTYLRRK